MSDWNFADVWDVVACNLSNSPALVQGSRKRTWEQVDARSNGLASMLLELGVQRQDKVAQYLYNCPEYIESVYAAFKAALVPVNTNYRYGPSELEYLWDNSDAVAVIFHASFSEIIEPLRSKLPKVRSWIWVNDFSGESCPDWALPYEEAAASGKPGMKINLKWARSGDDIYMLYTGGTTGMPKGVMWRQDDLFSVLNQGSFLRFPAEGTVDDVKSMITSAGPVHLSACPLMHGTGSFTSFNALSTGGCVVTLESKGFDPVELLDTVERDKVNVIAFVGDAFAKPVLERLDSDPGRWDLSSLKILISSGVMFSEQSKQGLLKHHAGMLLVDAFSSSEAMGMGQSISSVGGGPQTATFSLGENAKVIDEDAVEVVPGSGRTGRLAVRGRTPIGYYKDPEKSARTFPVIDGVRWSIPGDYATVDADGTVHVLGRGSQCINTGGEKVYPEEVEEVLKLHPGVKDTAIVGIPNARFGEEIWAIIQPSSNVQLDSVEISDFVKSRLASYKAPRGIVIVESLSRSPSGKLDYKLMKEKAIEQAGLTRG